MGFFDAQGIDTSKPQTQANTTGTATSNVAPWAQPYVNQYLTGAQNLISQGVQPTALQNQSYIGAANLTMPGAFGTAESLATQAGQGQLASAPIAYGYGTQGSQYGTQGANLGIAGGAQYGSMGAGIGQQATQAQQNYQNMATSPQAMAAYMNPYVQQSLAPQLQLLNQQQALQNQQIQGQATGQGAFGGNRATLAQGLNSQNYDLAKQQAIAQGYNTAFQNAQQAQQFGSNLGLQGLGVGIQGAQTGLQGVGTQLAGTGQGMQGAQVGLQGVSGAQNGYNGATNSANALTNLGTAQVNAAMGIAGLQNQLGTQQYNMPYQQLQFGQSMLSGLPISQQNTTGQQIGYQAAPNKSSQIGGLGTAALGALGLLGKDGVSSIGGGLSSIGGGIKSAYNYLTGSGGNPYITNSNPAMDNRDVGSSQSMDSGFVAPVAGRDYITGSGAIDSVVQEAKGGIIRSYAKGGLVTLALRNALRGAV